MNSEELSARMAQYSEKLIKAKAALASEQSEMEILRKAERDAQEALRRASHERSQREQDLAEKKAEARRAQEELDKITREWQRRAHEEKQARDKAENERVFNERIKGKVWLPKAMPHQMTGAMFLANAESALCGDDMGVGKTLQSIMTMDMLDAKRILVVAPNAVVPNFIEELQMWAPHRLLLPLMGKNKMQRESLIEMYRNVSHFVVVIGYSAWVRDPSLIEHLKSMQFDMIVCDEAQKLKDESAQAFQGVRKLRYVPNKCTNCNGWLFAHDHVGVPRRYISTCLTCNSSFSTWDEKLLSVRHMLPMTGTPVINRPQDSFALLHLVNRAVFPNRKKFESDYCWQSDETGRWYWNTGGESRLANEIKAFYLQRKRHQTGVKIPPQRPVVHEFELTPEEYPHQYESYTILAQLQQIIADTKTDAEIMGSGRPITHLLRMRQMITWPAGIEWIDTVTKQVIFKCDIRESIKVDKAVDIARDVIDGGGRVVLFSQFRPPLEEIQRRMGDRCAILNGDTSEAMRTRIRHDFDGKHDGPTEWDMVCVNYKVGSLGINLVGATDAILLDREWSPANESQALRRIDRMGQVNETRAHYIRVINTVDDRIDQLIHEKTNMVNAFETETNLMQVLRDAYNK